MADIKYLYVDQVEDTKQGAPSQSGEKSPGITNYRSYILQAAENVVNGDRNVDYGDPIDDFRRTATMWGAYLQQDLQPHDVAAMMAMLKISRIKWSPLKEDHWLDLAGYAACGFDCSQREQG